MPVLDSGFKIVTRVSGRQLALVAIPPMDDWAPIVSEVQTIERFADRAFRARRGQERFVVYFEAYTYWRKEAPWNLLAKSGLLSERERLPTVSLVYILRPRRYKPQQGRVELTVQGQTTQYLRLYEICLWELEPQPWWETVPGLMALYPLCRHGRSPRQAVSYAAGAIKAVASDTIVRADLLTTLAIFGKLAYKQYDFLSLIGREQMKESPLYEEIKDEGRLETGQAYVLAVLEERFGSAAAAPFTDAVHRVSKLAKLDRLLRLASRCDDLEEFQRAVRAR
jgi:hypothetical protein